jgi:hypothetical protein
MNDVTRTSAKDKLPLIEWVLERFENCVRIAKTKEAPADRDGWLEDAAYFREILVILNAQSSHEPPADQDTGRYCVEVAHCDCNADFHIWDGHCNTATAADAEALQVQLNRAAPPPPADQCDHDPMSHGSTLECDKRGALICKHCDTFDRSHAWPAPPPVPEWEPVETMPFVMRVLVYVPIENHRMVIAYKQRQGLILDEHMAPMAYPPSHWRHLPSTPTKETGR